MLFLVIITDRYVAPYLSGKRFSFPRGGPAASDLLFTVPESSMPELEKERAMMEGKLASPSYVEKAPEHLVERDRARVEELRAGFICASSREGSRAPLQPTTGSFHTSGIRSAAAC